MKSAWFVMEDANSYPVKVRTKAIRDGVIPPGQIVNSIRSTQLFPSKKGVEIKVTEKDRIPVIRFLGATFDQYSPQECWKTFITLAEYRAAKIKLQLQKDRQTSLDAFRPHSKYHRMIRHGDLVICKDCVVVTCVRCGQLNPPRANYCMHFSISLNILINIDLSPYFLPDEVPVKSIYGEKPVCEVAA